MALIDELLELLAVPEKNCAKIPRAKIPHSLKVSLPKTVKCGACGCDIVVLGKACGRRKFCDSCKYVERKKCVQENSRGKFRMGNPLKITKFKARVAADEQRRSEKLTAKAKKASDKLIAHAARIHCNKLALAEKYAPLILLRRSGATLKVVGEAFNLSGERVRQIVEKYSELIPSHTQESQTDQPPKSPEAR